MRDTFGVGVVIVRDPGISRGFRGTTAFRGTIEGNIVKVPEEFRQMAHHMHQDIFLNASSEAELFAYLARVPEGRGRKSVVDFIDGLLASDLSHDELAEICANAGADWVLQGNTARKFLKRLRNETITSAGSR